MVRSPVDICLGTSRSRPKNPGPLRMPRHCRVGYGFNSLIELPPVTGKISTLSAVGGGSAASPSHSETSQLLRLLFQNRPRLFLRKDKSQLGLQLPGLLADGRPIAL